MIPNTSIDIIFPSNQNLYDNYQLDIAKRNITNVRQLRQAIAQRLYLRPTNIHFICNQKQLTDQHQQINTLLVENPKTKFFVLVTEPSQQNLKNLPRIMIGGIDVSIVKHLQEQLRLKEKVMKQQQQKKAKNIGNRIEKQQGQIDYKQKYKASLQQLKATTAELGIELDDQTLLICLNQSKGNADRALDNILNSQ